MDGTGALILATATGSGFGGAMALGSWGEGTVLQHLVEVARTGGVDVVVVTIGPRANAVVESGDLGDALIVVNGDYEEGAASSLRAGLDTMWRQADIETVIIMELKRPGVFPEAVAALMASSRTNERPITVPKYRYARGSPIAIDRSLWPRLMGLEGHFELLDLVAAHPGWVDEIRLDLEPPAGVGTPEDLDVAARRRRFA